MTTVATVPPIPVSHSAPAPPAATTAVGASRLSRDPVDRLDRLFDAGSMMPFPRPEGSEMVAATGRAAGIRAVAFASDPSVQGGAMSSTGCGVIVSAYEHALAEGLPVVGLWHSGGARLSEGVTGLHGVGRVFAAMTRASGEVPQISVVLGAAAGGAAYGPALTDVVIVAPEGRVFVTGPGVVRSATGEEIDAESLGGPQVHDRRSGVSHVTADSEDSALASARWLCRLLVDRRRPSASGVADHDLARHVPQSPARAYEIRPLVHDLLDEPGLELQRRWAPNIVTTLGRIGGGTVGVLANNPLRLAGCLDAKSAEKAARFVRFCDAFGVPLVVLVDVPGYLPGSGQESDGVVRRGAKLLHAFAEAVVPRLTLVLRKAYGGAYLAMNGRALGADSVLSWPDAEVAVMSPLAAIRILHRRTLAGVADQDRDQTEQQLAAEYAQTVGGLTAAVDAGLVDEIVSPAATRVRIAEVLSGAPQRRGRHNNIPL